MAIITISRQFGAGGRTLGERLAKKLTYRYVHEDMIKEVAKRAKVSNRQIREFEKRGTTKLTKFLDRFMSSNFIDRLTAETYGYVDERKYVDAVTAIVEELHKEGNVVIIGRGSQFILKSSEDTLHLLLVADLKHRIRFLVEKYDLKESDAENAINRADQTRRRFLTFYAAPEEHDNPLNYDLTLNMERINMSQAEQLVLNLVS